MCVLSSPSLHWMNQPEEPAWYISQKTHRLLTETLCIKNTWRKMKTDGDMKEKSPEVGWPGQLRGVVTLGGMKQRPLSPFMMLIAYRHPLTVSSQPYCKSKTRQTARGNTLPPLQVCYKNHNIWCLMPEIASHFLLSQSVELFTGEQTGRTK